MGCDIHLYVEYKKDGVWHSADNWVFDNRWGDEQKWRVPYHQKAFDNRDYNFFGFLANVRNGTWGNPMPVAAEPRGLPEDTCERIKTESDIWGGDGHSHSFLTYKELKEAWDLFKDTKVKYSGAMHPSDNPEFQRWVALPEELRPSPSWGYSQAAFGPEGSYPHYVWYESVKESLKRSYFQLADYLNDATFEFNVEDEDIRAVFWFDN